MTRRGFTLVELLVAMVLFGALTAGVVAEVRSAGRAAERSTALLRADRALLSLRTFLQHDLRDAAGSDVVLLTSSKIRVARPVGEAILCGNVGGDPIYRDSDWTGTRDPVAGRDVAWLLTDPVTALWLQLPIDSVGPDHCPADGARATRLFVGAHAGTPMAVRVSEPVELSAYRSGAADWFGLTPASHLAVVQPFAGPLVPGTTRFVHQATQLDVTVAAIGRPLVVLQLPLGSAP